MSNRLEVGGLAVITGAVFCPESIGKVVTLVEFFPAGKTVSTPDGITYQVSVHDGWVVASESGLVTIKNGFTMEKVNTKFAGVRAYHLTPIGKDPDAEVLRSEQPIGEVA